MGDKKQSVGDLVHVIGEILMDLPKPCTEKDIKKSYHNIKKENINVALDEIGDKVGGINLYYFLRYHCKEICEVITNDGVVRIHRSNNNNTNTHETADECEKKKGKKKHSTAPKLNVPRVSLAVLKNQHPPNSQWGKLKNEKLTASSRAGAAVNFPNVYRPLDKLQQFFNPEDFQEEAEEVDEKSYIVDRSKIDDNTTVNLDSINFEQKPPKFTNPFEFPPIADVGTNDNNSELSEIKLDQEHQQKLSWVEKSEMNPTKRKIAPLPEVQVQKLLNSGKKIETSLKMELTKNKTEQERKNRTKEENDKSLVETFNDEMKDKILSLTFPDIVMDSSIQSPLKKMNLMEKFMVKLTVLYSPYQFYFECIDESNNFFMNEMKSFYDQYRNDLALKIRNMKPDMMVAVEVGTWWLRGKILSPPNNQNLVCVYFIDSGFTCDVEISSMCFLLKNFAIFPINAHRGTVSLAKVDDTTTEETRKKFFDLVDGRILIVQLKAHDEKKNVYELEFKSM